MSSLADFLLFQGVKSLLRELTLHKYRSRQLNDKSCTLDTFSILLAPFAICKN